MAANTDMYNFKTVIAQQTKSYKNNKEKQYKTDASIWFNKIYRVPFWLSKHKFDMNHCKNL